MAVTDAQIVAAAARWSEETIDAKELASAHAQNNSSSSRHQLQQLPAVVKVSKGQYSALGLPSLSCPGLAQLALVVSAGRQRTLLAQAVKLKEGRRVSSAGARVLIPESYGGYFELLSEEGRAARCLESVAELARRRPAHGCLLRQPLRALAVTSSTHQSTHPNNRQLRPNSAIIPNPGLEAVAPRTLPAGETLYPCDEVQPEGAKGRYLRCTDSRGEVVLLGLEQRGRFSVLAREDSVSGVHTARNLLSKRLPLTVRLVSGPPPIHHKSDARTLGAELRLLTAFDGEMLFALPLNTKDSAAANASSLIALPFAAPLKLLKARNDDQLRSMREFQRLAERATRLAMEVADRAHVLDGKLSEPKRRGGATAANEGVTRSPRVNDDVIASCDENRVPCPGVSDDYDEIDQIYDYVRGFAPLPKSVRSSYCDPSRAADSAERRSKEAPDPPPIDTIPGKGGSPAAVAAAASAAAAKAEKRTRKHDKQPPAVSRAPATPTAASLYVKNGGSSQRARILRQKSSSPLKETKLGSPLFNIRYKSLSNLQQQQQQVAALQAHAHAQMVHGQMETDGGGGTLDSSHSGGEKLVPEKRFRRLSRPRSLTNLVWGHTHAHERKRIGTLYL